MGLKFCAHIRDNDAEQRLHRNKVALAQRILILHQRRAPRSWVRIISGLALPIIWTRALLCFVALGVVRVSALLMGNMRKNISAWRRAFRA